jgi:UDP-glucose 4-epimerase
MNILVVGGAGYIGSHCVRQIIAAGHRPVILDSLVYGHKESVPAGTAVYDGSMGDEKLLAEIFAKEKIDLVMHFAAFCYVGESVQDPLKYYENNVAEPVRLLKAMMKAGVKRFVLSSTCAVYGIPSKVPMTEELPLAPINPYGETKRVLENVLRSLAVSHGLSFAAFRYFNAAGASADGAIGEDHHPETHLIPLAIDAATGKGPALKVFGTDYPTPDGTCLRDYVHVDDLSRAHVAVFDKLSQPGTALFYNLGTGKPTSVYEVIAAVEKVTGKKVPYSTGERRAGDPPTLYADSSKAQRELGWKPQYSDIESIVATAWKWHEKNPKGFA